MKGILLNLSAFLLLVIAPAVVLGDVEFTTPIGTSAFTAGESVTITWKDSGEQPTIAVADGWTLDLCTGSDTDPDCSLSGLVTGTKTGTFATSTVLWTMPTVGVGNGRYFFLRMIWSETTGSVINWSDRFSITGILSGGFSPAQSTANALPWTMPTRILPQNQAAPTAADVISYSVDYTDQVGPTRYAPMQLQPGTTITAKGAKRQYPTSAFTIFKTIQGPPDVSTTMTQPWSYTLTSVVNGASPAPNPSDSMQKFLNRWKD